MARELSKEEYLKLFEMFCGKDPIHTREVFLQPFKQFGHYIATDYHSAIILPCDKTQIDFIEQEKPNVFSILSKTKCLETTISVSKLEQALVPEMIDEEITTGKYVTCDECGERGLVGWEYKSHTKEFECPECDGSGYSEEPKTHKTGKQIPNPRRIFRAFGDVGFYDKELRRLVEACKFMGEETIVRVAGGEKSANEFKVGDFTIVVMPCMISAWDLTEVTEIKDSDILIYSNRFTDFIPPCPNSIIRNG